MQERFGDPTLAVLLTDLGPRALFGPGRLRNGFLGDRDPIGGAAYLAEWGAVGPAVVRATGEARRYITSVFVHESLPHALVLGIVTVIAASLIERRCAAPLARFPLLLASRPRCRCNPRPVPSWPPSPCIR